MDNTRRARADVRKLDPVEVELHRALRLDALRDSPNSFGERYSAASELDIRTWKRRTQRAADGEFGVTFIAEVDEVACGCAYGLFDAERPDVGRVGGMWVARAHRGRGIATALLAEVLAWTRESQLHEVLLWVPSHENAALRLCGRAGFVLTGESRALPVDAAYSILEMVRVPSTDNPHERPV